MGGANAYNPLKNMLEPFGYEVVALNYPGHESRIMEDLLESVQEIARDMYQQISRYLNEDYCLLGYSMGGMVCYELYQHIMKNNRKPPLHIFLLAADDPNADPDFTDCKNMTIQRVRSIFAEMGGTPDEILESDDMMEFLQPVTKADLYAIEKYVPTQNYKIECSVTLIRGTGEDNERCPWGWNQYLSKPCDYHEVEGEHFFMFSSDEALHAVCNLIKKAL
jgi:surfactin synthase thioesterase subunit